MMVGRRATRGLRGVEEEGEEREVVGEGEGEEREGEEEEGVVKGEKEKEEEVVEEGKAMQILCHTSHISNKNSNSYWMRGTRVTMPSSPMTAMMMKMYPLPTPLLSIRHSALGTNRYTIL